MKEAIEIFSKALSEEKDQIIKQRLLSELKEGRLRLMLGFDYTDILITQNLN